jgi:hypothetical protein
MLLPSLLPVAATAALLLLPLTAPGSLLIVAAPLLPPPTNESPALPLLVEALARALWLPSVDPAIMHE